MKSIFRTVVLTFVSFCAIASEASAMCFIRSLDMLLKATHAVMIFRGTVVQARNAPSGQIVTFDVGRVWKGDIGKRVVLYNVLEGEEIAFTVRTDYFVVAQRQNPMQQAKMGLRPLSVETLSPDCMTAKFDSPLTRQILSGAL